MQTENLANSSHKQFHVQLNSSQIKLYNYPDLTHDLTRKKLSLLLVVQATLNFSISTRNGKEEIAFLKINTKSHQFIKHGKFSHSIALTLLFIDSTLSFV